MTQHTVHRFDEELERIRNDTMEMGGFVEQQLTSAMAALVASDSVLAKAVRSGDKRINQMNLEIDKNCALLLARRTPVAADLRLVLSSVKIVNDLERIGDESKRIAKIVLMGFDNTQDIASVASLEDMGEQVKRMMHKSLDALARFDAQAAEAVFKEDRKVNSAHNAILSDILIATMMGKQQNTAGILCICWVVRALERIGDHCRNICEHVIYLVKGEDVRYAYPAKPAE
uniref:Phosphate-specific transport system accessory protein PhoU n=1 Tax=Candidatus Kentrum sp. FM TaxID=2126340 RepID=A0A450TG81_9GAMM|nr:MAG: phosphate transport system protein [Candidatus Kentron sp. FM]VFJ66183.1 MAG: phosphate transport system protein [Candidatus Kentron sp. FM]VFK06481.1 MAG: phosphate transport system protein [Candidatus Kentron sp. FM]